MRRNRFLAAALAAGLLAPALLFPHGAGATTGPTYLPMPKYVVPRKIEERYKGEYKLQRAAKPLRLRSAAFSIIVTDRGVLYGIGQFYGYDAKGFQDSWLAVLYQFRVGRKGLMTVDLVGPGGFPVLGHLYVHRDRKGNLFGQMTLAGKSRKYAVTWKKTKF